MDKGELSSNFVAIKITNCSFQLLYVCFNAENKSVVTHKMVFFCTMYKFFWRRMHFTMHLDCVHNQFDNSKSFGVCNILLKTGMAVFLSLLFK